MFLYSFKLNYVLQLADYNLNNSGSYSEYDYFGAAGGSVGRLVYNDDVCFFF